MMETTQPDLCGTAQSLSVSSSVPWICTSAWVCKSGQGVFSVFVKTPVRAASSFARTTQNKWPLPGDMLYPLIFLTVDKIHKYYIKVTTCQPSLCSLFPSSQTMFRGLGNHTNHTRNPPLLSGKWLYPWATMSGSYVGALSGLLKCHFFLCRVA